MVDSAEEALAALARDLVEEIAAGRALELAGGWEPSAVLAADLALDGLELASHQRDILELASFRVRPFQRVREGKPEQVHGYQETRLPGMGALPTPGAQNEVGAKGGWIPEADWLKGEQEWKAKGEAAWKKHEWKGTRKPKTTQDVFNGIRDTRKQSPGAAAEAAQDRGQAAAWGKVDAHLDHAQEHLSEHGLQAGQIDQDKTAQAYHSLAQAHDHIVSHIVPHAQPEQYPAIAQHLQKIAGHMQDLDQTMGANPQATRKLLGDGKEVMAHAGEARRAQGTAAAEKAADQAARDQAFQGAHQAAIAGGPQAHRQFMQQHGMAPLPKGAAAVHPQLGAHLLGHPGDSISGHAHAHVARPSQEAADQSALQAQQEAIAGSKAQESALKQEAAQAAREEKLQSAALERKGISPPGTYAPFTDSQFVVHTRNVERALNAAVNAGMATDQAYTLDKHGQVWEPDRASAHAGIIRDYLDKTVNVPSQRAALFVGGLPGAGKSTLLKNHPGIDPKDYAAINPDDFKEELAKRGMVPQVEGLSPLESSTLIHGESVHLANLAAAELQRRGKNLAFDVTMAGSLRVSEDRIAALKKAGYGVSAMFVDIPVETSAQRVLRRYRSQLEKYRAGTSPLGGRYIPEHVIMDGESANRACPVPGTAFDSLRSQFSRWELYDGKEAVPRLAEKSGPAQPPGGGIASVEELMRQQGAKAASRLPSAAGPARDQAAAASGLEKSMASGQVSSNLSPQQGATSEVRFVTYGDGSRWVMKDTTPRLNSAEELSAMVSSVVGAGAPGIVIKGDMLYHPYVEGKPGNALSKAEQEAAYASPAGRKIGLLDIITGIADRGEGNWISTSGGAPVPIDQGSTFSDMHWSVEKIARRDPFARSLISAPGTFSPEELSRIRDQVAALQPEAASRSHQEQFTQALARLDDYIGNTEALARAAEQGGNRPAVVSSPEFEEAAEFATAIMPGTAAMLDQARQAPDAAAARAALEEVAVMLDGASGFAARAAASAVRKLLK